MVDYWLQGISPYLVAFRRRVQKVGHNLGTQGSVRFEKFVRKIHEDDFLAVGEFGDELIDVLDPRTGWIEDAIVLAASLLAWTRLNQSSLGVGNAAGLAPGGGWGVSASQDSNWVWARPLVMRRKDRMNCFMKTC